MTTVPEDEDQTASVDLSVAFFCSIVMLLAFVSFEISEVREQEPRSSLGQIQPVLDAVPPTWNPVLTRGGWAVLTQTGLTRLDLAPLMSQIGEGENGIVAENGGVSWRAVSNSVSARAFRLDIGIDLDDVPLTWRGETASFVGEEPAPCFETPALLTVILSPDLPDMMPFLEFAARCAIPHKFHFTPEPSDGASVVRFSIGLSPASYSRDRIFR